MLIEGSVACCTLVPVGPRSLMLGVITRPYVFSRKTMFGGYVANAPAGGGAFVLALGRAA